MIKKIIFGLFALAVVTIVAAHGGGHHHQGFSLPTIHINTAGIHALLRNPPIPIIKLPPITIPNLPIPTIILPSHGHGMPFGNILNGLMHNSHSSWE